MSQAKILEIEGLAELSRKLNELSDMHARRVTEDAMLAAMSPVCDRAKELAPQPGEKYATGALRDAIRLALARDKKDGTLSVGLRLSKRKVKGETWSADPAKEGGGFKWHWVEFGIPSRKIAPQPFLRPAFNSNVERMLGTLRYVLGKAIDAIAAGKGAK